MATAALSADHSVSSSYALTPGCQWSRGYLQPGPGCRVSRTEAWQIRDTAVLTQDPATTFCYLPYSPRPLSSEVPIPSMASESPLFSPQEVFASTFVNSVRIAKFHLTAGSSVYQIVALCIRNYPGTKHVGIPTENEGFFITSAPLQTSGSSFP